MSIVEKKDRLLLRFIRPVEEMIDAPILRLSRIMVLELQLPLSACSHIK